MQLPALALVMAEAAEEEAAPPVIDIDGTVLIQFAIFVIMFFVLRTFLFKPYMNMREQRALHIDGAQEKAQESERKSADLEAQFQERMKKVRADADTERARMQQEGRARETELLGQARERAQARINTTRAQIAVQVAAAQAELTERADALGHSLASKLLGREV
jgi:F-type H+-transporting ATPase subunit b